MQSVIGRVCAASAAGVVVAFLGACSGEQTVGERGWAPRDYEVYAEVSEGIGNIAVSPEGDVYLSMHQFLGNDFKVGRLVRGQGPRDCHVEPYPTGHWQGDLRDDGVGLDSVLGIACDSRGVLWMLDNGRRSGVAPRLVAWDTKRDRLERIIPILEPVSKASMLNDLAVDRRHGAVYIADMGGNGAEPAIIVVDIESGRARRLLEGRDCVRAEPGAVANIDGRTLDALIGLNPIVLDTRSEWLYFGAMNGRTLYRVRTLDVLDESLTDASLYARVEPYGEKAISDGITMDSAGNAYISDLGASGIGVTRPDGTYELLFSGDELSWPDAMSFGRDGWVYVACNALQNAAPLNRGVNASSPPYYVIRFRPIASGVAGH
ncbi:MAG: L-dopachrome tautomerase-related protein [Phycisphaerales bacterium]